MTKQIEMEKERLAFMEKEKLIHKLEPWRDDDKPEAFFKKFEKVMVEAAVPQEQWAVKLTSLLSGKLQNAYSSHVPPSDTGDYKKLKAALLEAMGRSLQHCRRHFWSYHQQYSDSPHEICQELESLLTHLIDSCETKEIL